eukprot:961159-Prorocentrum_minimum.AAC.1
MFGRGRALAWQHVRPGGAPVGEAGPGGGAGRGGPEGRGPAAPLRRGGGERGDQEARGGQAGHPGSHQGLQKGDLRRAVGQSEVRDGHGRPYQQGAAHA